MHCRVAVEKLGIKNVAAGVAILAAVRKADRIGSAALELIAPPSNPAVFRSNLLPAMWIVEA